MITTTMCIQQRLTISLGSLKKWVFELRSSTLNFNCMFCSYVLKLKTCRYLQYQDCSHLLWQKVILCLWIQISLPIPVIMQKWWDLISLLTLNCIQRLKIKRNELFIVCWIKFRYLIAKVFIDPEISHTPDHDSILFRKKLKRHIYYLIIYNLIIF